MGQDTGFATHGAWLTLESPSTPSGAEILKALTRPADPLPETQLLKVHIFFHSPK